MPVDTYASHIDPVEALVAVTGLGLLTGERQADISEDEIERAIKLPEKLTSIAKQACNGTAQYRTAPVINQERAVAKLSKMQRQEDHVQRASKFPPGFSKLAAGYNVFLHQLQPQILSMLPRSVQNSVTGPQIGPANDLDTWRFLLVLHALDEPISMFKAVANGTISRKQAMAVQMAYPSLSQDFTDRLMACIAEKQASPTTWIPPWKLTKGLSAWLGADSLPAGMLKRLQESHVLSKARQAPPEPRVEQDEDRDEAGPALHAQFSKQS